MRFLPRKFVKKQPPRHQIAHVMFTADSLVVSFQLGRTTTIPLTRYPRLLHATVEERETWQLVGPGTGIHWPSLDEDISAENILEGKPSLEGEGSLRRWLTLRGLQAGTA